MPAPFPGGAVARGDGVGWVLAEERPERALGGALAWARHAGLAELHVLAEAETGLLARRAGAFARPPRVWRVEGRAVEPAEPAPPAPEAPLSPAVAAFVPPIEAAGAEPVVEHGVLRGEVLGLEVARVVEDDDGVRLEVGVGAFDREAQRLVHGDRPPAEALARAVAAVRDLRTPTAPEHQMNRLALERWMRRILVRRPELVGAALLEPVPSPVRRTDLRQQAPAPAAGRDADGGPLVVVCSTGIDVDLVPAAADARIAACSRIAGGRDLAGGGDARLLLVVPEADDHPVTRSLAGALARPAEVVTLAGEWRSL